MAEVRWTFEALRCLEEIHGYIAADNPRAAVDVVRGIFSKVQLLCEHPRLGQRYEPVSDREVRETFYGHYRIAYLIVNEARVVVLGVFHASMDIEWYLH